jgi:hypothetical protein
MSGLEIVIGLLAAAGGAGWIAKKLRRLSERRQHVSSLEQLAALSAAQNAAPSSIPSHAQRPLTDADFGVGHYHGVLAALEQRRRQPIIAEPPQSPQAQLPRTRRIAPVAPAPMRLLADAAATDDEVVLSQARAIGEARASRRYSV